jgi:GGDEF domain-containing protein
MNTDLDTSGRHLERIEQRLDETLRLAPVVIEEHALVGDGAALVNVVAQLVDLKRDGGEQHVGTQVGSRQQAILRMTLELDRVGTGSSTEFSVVMVQFDGLGLVANRLGDAFQEDPLVKVTALLMKELGAYGVCFRLGIDEFLLIYPGKGQPECRDFAEHLDRGCAPGVGRHAAGMAFSIGFASSPAQGCTVSALFAAADLAMREHSVPITITAVASVCPPLAVGLLAGRPIPVATA